MRMEFVSSTTISVMHADWHCIEHDYNNYFVALHMLTALNAPIGIVPSYTFQK